jgi:hypothetical protein
MNWFVEKRFLSSRYFLQFIALLGILISSWISFASIVLYRLPFPLIYDLSMRLNSRSIPNLPPENSKVTVYPGVLKLEYYRCVNAATIPHIVIPSYHCSINRNGEGIYVSHTNSSDVRNPKNGTSSGLTRGFQPKLSSERCPKLWIFSSS